MQLNEQGLANRQEWLSKGYSLPEFDREAVKAKQKRHRAGSILAQATFSVRSRQMCFRDFLNKGIWDSGLVVAEGFDYEIVEKMNIPHDGYTVLVTLKVDGTVEKTVVGSVVESLR